MFSWIKQNILAKFFRTRYHPKASFKPEFPTQSHLNHAIARALLRGSAVEPRRPALPFEIVILIFNVAASAQSMPNPQLAVKSSVSMTVFSARRETQAIFFVTPPITRDWLSRVCQMALVTVSRDQGWMGTPEKESLSWFDIQLMRLDGRNKLVPKSDDPNTPMRWFSHHNIIASHVFAVREGVVFTSDHEIWYHLEEGDIIAVLACARNDSYGFVWQNVAKTGHLQFWEKFDPRALL